jgi:hypothetical protein
MPGRNTETSNFPVAMCESCGKTVLTFVAFDGSHSEYRACVHCEKPVAGPISWVDAGGLAATGYEIVGIRPAGHGCGCGSGGCGMRRS